MFRGLALVAVMLVATGVASGDDADPWSPGSSMDPWPLIATLQGSASGSSFSAARRNALAHPDPRVRAAAAWAIGRAQSTDEMSALAIAAFDEDQSVRDAALWALLTLKDPNALRPLAEILAKGLDLSLRPTRPTEPAAGFSALAALRGIPVLGGPSALRREWYERVDMRNLDLREHHFHTSSGVRDVNWSTTRSEFDSGERASIRAHVMMSEADRSEPQKVLDLKTFLTLWDEPDRDPNVFEERIRMPVQLYRPDAFERDRIRLAPGEGAEIDLILPLHEIPPGVYILEGIETGHPLFLRIRRSPDREAETQRAAMLATTEEQVEALSRQRVASQAARLREQLRAHIAERRRPLPTASLGALARLSDEQAAGHLVEAAHAGTYDLDADGSVLRAFGVATTPHLQRVAADWRRLLDPKSDHRFLRSLVRARRITDPKIDGVRVDLLRELAPHVGPQGYEHHLFIEAFVAAAPRQPGDLGRALAAIADRPASLVGVLTLIAAQPGFSSIRPVARLDSLLAPAWAALAPETPPDSRSALAAEGERYGVSLPGSESAAPVSSSEAARELINAATRPGREGASVTLRRVLSSGLADTHGSLAQVAASLALALNDYDLAMRFAQRAVELTPSFPERARMLWLRAAVHAAIGNISDARADLESALTYLDPNVGGAQVRTRLQELEAVPVGIRLRERSLRSRRVRAVPEPDGICIDINNHVVEAKDLIRGETRVLGIDPRENHAWARLGKNEIALLATDGSVGVLRAGHLDLVWRTRVEGAGTLDHFAKLQRMTVAAMGDTVLARDSNRILHAFDARTGTKRWSRPSDESVPLVMNDSGLVILGEVANSDTRRRDLVGVDLQSGRVLWRTAASSDVSAWSFGDGRVAWVEGKSRLREIDIGSGRPLVDVTIPVPEGAHRNADVAVVPNSSNTVLALAHSLVLLNRGVITWSRPLPLAGAGSWARPKLQVGAERDFWRLVQGPGSVVAELWTLAGERIASYTLGKWSEVSTALVAPNVLAASDGEGIVLLDRAKR